MGAHTTSDDPTIYRTEAEVKKWKKFDPVVRFRKYLENKGYWNKAYEEKIIKWAEQKVEDAVKKAESTRPSIEDMFKYMYKDMSSELKDQLEYLKSQELGDKE